MSVTDAAPPAPAPRRKFRGATRKSVLIADMIADKVITYGGLSVILAVFGIMIFLAEVVVPLFTGSTVDGRSAGDRPAIGHAIFDRVDEYKTLSIQVADDGKISAFHIATGKPVDTPDFDFGGARATAHAAAFGHPDMIFGFADGSVRLVKLNVTVRILPGDQMPEGLTPLDARDLTDGRSIYSRITGNQIRQVSVALSQEPAQVIAAGKAIRALDYRIGGTVERPTQSFVSVDDDNVLRISRAEARRNLLTGRTTISLSTSQLPPLPAGARPVFLQMTTQADQVYVGGEDGTIHRYDTRDLAAPVLAERRDLLPGTVRLTMLKFLNGDQSLTVGGSDGTVDVYFLLPRAENAGSDGRTLVRAHRLEPQPGAIIAMDISSRAKTFVTADDRGNVWLRHSTSEQVLAKLPGPPAERIEAVALAPRDNGVLVLTEGDRYVAWDVSIPHPETTFASIFGKVWYEGYDGPEYTWQSSSGTDSFEPKLSLVPLIFGTLKATVYALLFAVPVALGAAIYTSEFVHHSVRAVVKPAMEMMASLPSVVLGFIAALILAPLVEAWLSAVLLAAFLLPFALILAARLWQMLPAPVALKYGGLTKFAAMFLVLGLAAQLSVWLSFSFERAFFAGDVKAWANGDIGSDAPLMTLVLMPVAAFALSRLIQPVTEALLPMPGNGAPRWRQGAVEALRWLLLLAAAAIAAFLLASLLIAVGLGLRGGVVDTYVQRNTLVVGFAMGFAVIPIIYTIAEDALNAVPEHLRGASLACGATPWQTAIGVVLPTAVSGVFAAVMVGLGRAVGETMIVVMAAGNTPVLEWNIFNGLRALSANIAVELPEAVRDDTLYRMLFLAALTLFVMTFVVNTLAEMVRLRFRKRAASL
ncbi:MAG: hypothetical protein OHK0024_19340 [Thalassobaculales bacterium]